MKYKLGECIEEIVDKTTENNQYEVLSVTKDGIYSQEEFFKKQIASEDNTGYKIIRKNNLVFSTMNLWMGSLDVLLNYEIGIVSPAYKIFKFDESKMTPSFGKYFMKSHFMLEQYKNCSEQGASVVRKNLDLKQLLDTEIIIPTVEEQCKIVKVLENIDEIINKYTNLIKNKEQFIKSQFVEMFENKKYEKLSGKELFSFSSGKFLEASKRLENGIPVYGGNGVAWYTDEPLIDFNTIVIGRVGVYCGNVKLIKEPVWITDNAIFIKQFKKDVYNIDFLYYMMELVDFSRFAQFSGQPKITQKPLEEFNYVVPPIEEQIKFSNIVRLIDKQKFNYINKIKLLNKIINIFLGGKKI